MLRVSVLSAALGLALAVPAAAQAPNVQQLLQGLTSGNQRQDQALHDAFERGYERGRQDEARLRRPDRSGTYRDDPGSRDDRGPDQSNGRQGSYTR